VLIGSAGPKFDTSITATGDHRTIAGNRLSFFSLCLSSSIAWAPAGADFYVYYPKDTRKWKTFTLTTIGVGLGLSFANLIGVGLGSGTISQKTWADALDVSSGALILEGYAGLRGFGKLLGVFVALGLIANNIPGTYSAVLGFQVLGRYGQRTPRWIISCVSVLAYTACAVAGRNSLFSIFEKFLALPHGVAALAAFLVGWVGAVLGMCQVYHKGPIAKQVSSQGADLGIWLGASWAMVVFPPLRWLELKRFGR